MFVNVYVVKVSNPGYEQSWDEQVIFGIKSTEEISQYIWYLLQYITIARFHSMHSLFIFLNNTPATDKPAGNSRINKNKIAQQNTRNISSVKVLLN